MPSLSPKSDNHLMQNNKCSSASGAGGGSGVDSQLGLSPQSYAAYQQREKSRLCDLRSTWLDDYLVSSNNDEDNDYDNDKEEEESSSSSSEESCFSDDDDWSHVTSLATTALHLNDDDSNENRTGPRTKSVGDRDDDDDDDASVAISCSGGRSCSEWFEDCMFRFEDSLEHQNTTITTTRSSTKTMTTTTTGDERNINNNNNNDTKKSKKKKSKRRKSTQPPFWYTCEDPSHLKKIVEEYNKEIPSSDSHCDWTTDKRRLPTFIGRIRRIPVFEKDSIDDFTTLDKIQFYRRDIRPCGSCTTPVTTCHAVTSWDSDGMPDNFVILKDKEEVEQWRAKAIKNCAVSYIYCLPVWESKTDFEYSVEKEKHEVGYAHQPFNYAPFLPKHILSPDNETALPPDSNTMSPNVCEFYSDA